MKKQDIYRVVPANIASSESLVKIITGSAGEDEIDVQLTLLGSPTLTSNELHDVISSKKYAVGSHIIVPFKYTYTLIPFKIFDYTSDGKAFCQSMLTLHSTGFYDVDHYDYKNSYVRQYLTSPKFLKRFRGDFVDNHVAYHEWDVDCTSDHDKIDICNDKFSSMNAREMLTYCRTLASRKRWNSSFKEIAWHLRDSDFAFQYQTNFINVSKHIVDDLEHDGNNVSNNIVPVCMIY